MMTRLLRSASLLPVCAALLLFVTLAGCDDDDSVSSELPDETNQTVGELIDSDVGSLSNLAAALDQAGLRDALDGDGPFTVFAPSNAAFGGIDADTLLDDSNSALLTEVLQYHVVSGQALASGDIGAPQTVTTLEGTDLTVASTDDGVTVNGNLVTVADIQGTNGVVHVVDGVLLESLKLQERAEMTLGLSTLAAGIEAAGLTTALNGTGPFTVFAPLNTAFGPFREGFTDDVDVLTELLTYHVIGDEILAGSISDGDVETTIEADGGSLSFSVGEEGVFVNGVLVETANVQVENGVIHLIDAVLASGLSVAERASITDGLTTLTTAIGGPDATTVPVLDDEAQSLTVFAPSDGSFDALDVDELVADAALLEEVLTYHVLDGGAFTAEDLESGSPTRTTAEGTTVRIDVDGETLLVNRAPVATPDVPVANGVVHVVDGVLLETTRGMERIELTSDYSLLQAAIERVGLSATLASGTYTIFAPTNEAFLAALDADNSGSIEESEFPSDAALEDILLYHVVPGTVPSSSIDDGQTATTLEGSSITFDVNPDDTITINPASDAAVVTVPDLDAENGVVHEIDTVLIP